MSGVSTLPRAEDAVMARTISHYELIEKVGEGGMGVVYKARDTQLDRLVAIKVLPADKVANPDRKLRFVQEAKAASALNHPNIVTIYEIGCENGADFIVMEFIAGRTLDHLIPRGGLKTAEVLKYAIHDGRCTRPRARGRHRPSRSQAGQHHDRR